MERQLAARRGDVECLEHLADAQHQQDDYEQFNHKLGEGQVRGAVEGEGSRHQRADESKGQDHLQGAPAEEQNRRSQGQERGQGYVDNAQVGAIHESEKSVAPERINAIPTSVIAAKTVTVMYRRKSPFWNRIYIRGVVRVRKIITC